MVNLLEYLGMEGLAWWCDVGKIDKGCGLRVLVGALSKWIFILGMGESWFWGDCWLGSDELKLTFARHFYLSLDKEAKLTDLRKAVDGSWEREFRWR
jgi:hypothetical protein